MSEICGYCGESATRKCAACQKVFYCSRDHQKLHWKEHSKSCRCFKLEKDSKVGRHYVATRKIDAGEIVLKDECPLVAGPVYGSFPVCLGCYVTLDSQSVNPCMKCGWPLCKNCKTHGSECEFTCKYKSSKVSITEYAYPHPTYRCVSVIRALSLKEANPESYQKLLSLEDHCDIATKDSEFSFDEPLDIARFVKRYFDTLDVPEKEIARIAGILQVNGHEVPITDVPYMAVYELASFLEHNCRANCSKTFTSNGGLVIRAAIPIAKGDHLSICYTDPLWGVTNRRHHLARTKFFECVCERCADPTELGTMFNALICDKKDCPGVMLPKTFLYKGDNLPDYTCDKCQSKRSWEEVEKTLEKIGVDLSQMTKNDVEACKTFINRYRTVLHENHFYNTDVKIALAQIIGQQSGGLPSINDDLLSEKILLCKSLDELLKTLVPAENRIRGLILFEMHAAVAEFGRRQGKDEFQGILMESRKLLHQAYQLLRHEPEILPEGRIAVQARKNLQEMDVLIKTLCQNALSPV